MGTPKTAKRRTQEERKAESERQIIRAACELFASQGYVRTTLNEIGQAAGYTGGLVSHRFSSKEGLLRAVVRHIAGRFLTDQLGDNIAKTSAEESLRNFLRIYLTEVTVREGRMRTLYVVMGEAMGAVPEIQESIAAINNGMRDQVAAIVQRGIDAGEFDKALDAKHAAVWIVGMVRGIVMQYLADGSAFKIARVLPGVQQAVIGGLK